MGKVDGTAGGLFAADEVVATPVATDAVTLELFEPVTAMLEGLRVQVEFWGAPVQVRATVPEVPLRPSSWRAKLAVWPLVMIAEGEPVMAMLKSSPWPESATTMDLARFAAETVRVPVAGPAAAGEKVMLIWQLAPTPSVAEQVLLAMAKPELTAAASVVSG